MGTRSLTVITDHAGKEIVVMYRQFDGYPSGHGKELAEFLKDVVLVNGISMRKEEKQRIANGMDCLAAQIVARFKLGHAVDQAELNKHHPTATMPIEAGSIYLYPAGTRDCGEEYIYTVSGPWVEASQRVTPTIGVVSVGWVERDWKKLKKDGTPTIKRRHPDKKLFLGTAAQFLEWLPQYEKQLEEQGIE